MARICHTNKCPVGITTQKEELRKRFPGTPENIVTYFGYVAEEVRSILATLGYKSIEEIIGRPGVLEPREGLKLKKIGTNTLDASFILNSLDCEPLSGNPDLCDVEQPRSWLKHSPTPFSNGITFDDHILADADIKKAVETNPSGSVITKSYHIVNTDRSAFARVAGQIAGRHGDEGFKSTLNFQLSGAAGQSFCAFICKGIEVKLTGYANDYVCKGMAGGTVVVNPPVQEQQSPSWRDTSKHSVVGNTVLYGATGGSLFVRGRGGERFAVRNSGALGVVEGLGDHGCEYMTDGKIIVLGATGRNFAAGMTGGLAFVIEDEDWLDGESADASVDFSDYVNKGDVTLIKLGADYQNAKAFLKQSLSHHFNQTGSKRAKRVLDNMDEALLKMWAVVPNAEKKNPIIASSNVAIAANASKA